MVILQSNNDRDVGEIEEVSLSFINCWDYESSYLGEISLRNQQSFLLLFKKIGCELFHLSVLWTKFPADYQIDS